MSRQLKDLFKDFLEMSPTEQLAKVQQIRDTRTIERPKSAQKRKKKEAKKTEKSKIKVKSLVNSMTDEQKAELIRKLKEEL